MDTDTKRHTDTDIHIRTHTGTGADIDKHIGIRTQTPRETNGRDAYSQHNNTVTQRQSQTQ